MSYDRPTPPPIPPSVPYHSELPPPRKSSNTLFTCLIIAAATMGVLALVCGGLGFFAYTKARSLAATIGTQVISDIVNQSELPPVEKQEILVQVNRLADAYRLKQIGDQEMQKILQDLLDSPLMTTLVLQGAQHKYLDSSGLTPDEKNEARITIARVVQGVMEKKISDVELKKITRHVLEVDQAGAEIPSSPPAEIDFVDPDLAEGPTDSGVENAASSDGTNSSSGNSVHVEWHQGNQSLQGNLKTKLTDQELRSMLAEAKQVADQAGIPTDVPPVQISQELKKILDPYLSPNR